MSGAKESTTDELEYLMEQKILEVFGDPNSGLQLKGKFKQEPKRRLEKPPRRIPHHEVVNRIGSD